MTRTDMSLLAHVKLRTGDFDNFWGHARIQEFSSGGGGVQVGLSKKKLRQCFFFFFFFFFFFSPQLILKKSNSQFQRNLSFFKVPEGVQHYPGGPTFSSGVQLLIPYRNPYNL